MRKDKPVQIENVSYPCGCSRRTNINARGWNYCSAHQRHYSAAEVYIEPKSRLIERVEPIQQTPFNPFAGQVGAGGVKLF